MSRIGRLGLALVVVLDCSPPRATSESSTARPDRNLISLPEIQAARTDNAYELVGTLHTCGCGSGIELDALRR